jgi:hypothetical protein
MKLAIPPIEGVFLQRAAVAAGNGEIVPINPRVQNGIIQVSGGGSTPATGTLTMTDVFVDTQTVTIGGEVYTSLDTLVDGRNNFLIGATLAETLINLRDAIRGEGEGVTCGRGTIEHPEVTAECTATTLVVTARELGTAANSIATTETQTNGSWSAANLAGGTAFVGTIEPLVSAGGHFFDAATVTPLAGTGVTSMTTIGQWILPTAGFSKLWCPITAYTSGLIDVRFLHTPQA